MSYSVRPWGPSIVHCWGGRLQRPQGWVMMGLTMLYDIMLNDTMRSLHPALQEREVAEATGEAIPHEGKLRALVLTPTRELALQPLTAGTRTCMVGPGVFTPHSASSCIHSRFTHDVALAPQVDGLVEHFSPFTAGTHMYSVASGMFTPHSAGQSQPNTRGCHRGWPGLGEARAPSACAPIGGRCNSRKV
eukprot:1151945-Pelagomonas_calceolata.AAC.6